MLRILKEILTTYDESVGERLSPQDGIMWPNKMRMALEAISAKPIPRVGFCHAHCIRKFGYRKHPRIIKTAFGKLEQPIFAQCRTSGARDAVQPQREQV